MLNAIALAALMLQPAPSAVPEIFAETQNLEVEFVVNTPTPTDWRPRDGDFAAFGAIMDQYLVAEWSGDWAKAYSLTTADFKADISLDKYRTGKEFKGKQTYFKALRYTWYPDPPSAPEPGLYLAVDFVGAFEKSPYYCGYVIVRRDPDGRIGIVRFEQNFVTSKEDPPLSATKLKEFAALLPCYKGGGEAKGDPAR